MKSKLFLLLIIGVLSLVGRATFAQDEGSPLLRNPAQLVQDREIYERAKSHSYKGGAEEGELRVQAQLPKAQRKIAPVVERAEDDKESQEHD
jgi:hypothetical protein